MDSDEHTRCTRWLNLALSESPAVVFMLERLDKAGCNFKRNNFKCLPTTTVNKGGFSPKHGIFLSENKIRSYADVEDSLTHNLIHAFDHTTTRIDWSNPEHHACSEIRATTLSGECQFLKEVMRGEYGFSKHHQACVRRKVVEKMRKVGRFVESGVVEDAVDAVFDVCFKDTTPFNEIY